MIAREVLRVSSACLLAGCASMQARQSANEQSQIVVDSRGTLDQVRGRVLAAFMANHLTVNSAQDQIVEAALPTEKGFLGDYDLVARAVLVPHDSVVTVTLYGEERRKSETKTFLEPGDRIVTRDAHRVSEYSQGRAGEVWRRLQSIARSLRSDSR